MRIFWLPGEIALPQQLEPRPRVQLETKFGLGLVALGIAIAAAWNMWARTRNLVPVDLPVSLVAGQSVTSNFTLNFDGLYLIQVEAQPILFPDQLHCLSESMPTQ